MKKILSYVGCLLVAVFIFVGFSTQIVSAYSQGDVLINEFRLDGAQWLELMNNTNSDISIDSTWQLISTVAGPGSATSTLSSALLPAKGLVTIDAAGLPTTAPTMLSLKNNGTLIYAMSYGTPAFGGEPHLTGNLPSGQSAVLTGGTTWSATSTITRGWYNEGPAPTIASIVSDINAGGVYTNLSGGIADYSAAQSFYFEKRTNLSSSTTALGKLEFAGPLNLTNASTTALLQNLGTKMQSAAGSMNFDARTALDLKNAGASITMYHINDIGYDVSSLSTSSMTVKDDTGSVLSGGSLPTFSSISASSTENGGSFTFTASHFTGFEFDPVLAEVTPVTTPTASTSPYYTFSSNVAGTYVKGSGCSGSASTIIGNNTIALGPLTAGTYNCTVKVIDGAGASSTLAVSSFTITDMATDEAAVNADIAALQANPNIIAGANPDLSHITTALSLIATGTASSSNITWVSASTTLVSNDGLTIHRPAYGQPNATTTLEATITKNSYYDNIYFNLTVLAAADSNTAAVAADKAALTAGSIQGANPDLSNITVHLTSPLPSVGTASSSNITWLSASPGLVSNDGQTINRPSYATGNATTTLTATISKGGTATDTKAFVLTVLALPSNNAKLSNLTISSGTLTPAFASTTLSYTATTSNAVTSVTFIPTASQASSTINVNGSIVASGAASGAIALSVGTTTVSIVVTAQDGVTISTTTVNVNRAPYNIQNAINAASPGDTITVPAGTYHENIIINKKLTLIGDIGTDTTGAGPSAPVIIANSCTRTVDVIASEVVLKGFVIDNDGCNNPAVRVAVNISSTTIRNNDLRNASYGVTLAINSNNNTITKNKIYSNTYGMFINGSVSNIISYNEIATSSSNGIEFVGNKNAGNNNINNNNIHSNSGNGIQLGPDLNTSAGVINVDSNILVLNGWAGVRIESGTSDVSITGNTITNNGQGESFATGIHLVSALGNSAHGNIITDDAYGIGINNEDGDYTFDATQNYWGTESGPYDATGDDGNESSNTGGNASSTIIGLVDYTPWFKDADMTSLKGNPTENGDGTKTYTITEELDATNGGNNFVIPAGTIATGTSGWTGEINAPTVTTITLPVSAGYTKTVSSAIELGFPGIKLSFSKGVRILMPNQAGKRVGYTRDGGATFTEITATCAADDQATGDLLGVDGDCKINASNGLDLVVWTKHFTTFVTYTQTTSSTGGGVTQRRPAVLTTPVTTAVASATMSIPQFIQLLIDIGVISPDKVLLIKIIFGLL